MLRPAPSSRLLNLTGFFSRVVGAAATDIVGVNCVYKGPDQGMRVLRRKGYGRGLKSCSSGSEVELRWKGPGLGFR